MFSKSETGRQAAGGSKNGKPAPGRQVAGGSKNGKPAAGKPVFAGQINTDERSAAPDEDSALVADAQNGDFSAFEELVKKYESKVYGISLRMLQNGEDAKDAAQDVFLKVYRSLGNFRGESKFSTWLYRITNNVCLDILRKQSRRDIAVEIDAGYEDGDNKTVEIASDVDVEAAVEDAEFRSLVHKAIGMLPDQHRAMIVMRDVQSMSYTAISEILELPEGTVKSRINRARKNLRAIFLSFKELKEYINV